ncbi:MAG: methyltransferase [Propionibacteriaceae bacterium]|nr:methyltransferase [Propionibacteriaceae bacterium]
MEESQPMNPHYFTTPQGVATRREITMTFWGRSWTFDTADGVFSGSRLDPGTAVLLREVAPDAVTSAGRLLDLGCGYGVIAVALAVCVPGVVVDAVDVNERALELCARNAERYGVSARVHPLLPEQANVDIRYDQLWSNPPIRIGKPALHELLAAWLARLADDGVAHLVVGKNLGADSLQTWLVSQGWVSERIASAKGFRVFQVRR